MCSVTKGAPLQRADFFALKSLKAISKLSVLPAPTYYEQFLSHKFLLDVSENQCSLSSFTLTETNTDSEWLE